MWVLLSAFLVAIAASAIVTESHSRTLAQSTVAVTQVSGIVVNGTAGSIPPTGATVVLFVIENSTGTALERRTTTVANDGMFAFQQVTAGPDIAYRVAAEGKEYSPFVDILPNVSTSNITLTTWDFTHDPAILRIGQYSVIAATIHRRERRIVFLGSLNVRNSADVIWVPKPPEAGLTGPDLFRFNLPEGYENLSVETDLPEGNILEIGTGFALTTPVPPGQHSLIMSYSVVYEEEALSIPFRLAHGADNFRFLLPTDSGRITGNGLTFVGALEVPTGEQSISFDAYEGSGYQPGAALNITITELPGPTLVERSLDWLQGSEYVVGLGIAVGVLLVGLIAFAVLRLRAQPKPLLDAVQFPNTVTAVPDSDNPPPTTEDNSQEIIAQLAALEDEREEGTISENAYIEQRERLMRAAIAADRTAPMTEQHQGNNDEQ